MTTTNWQEFLSAVGAGGPYTNCFIDEAVGGSRYRSFIRTWPATGIFCVGGPAFVGAVSREMAEEAYQAGARFND